MMSLRSNVDAAPYIAGHTIALWRIFAQLFCLCFVAVHAHAMDREGVCELVDIDAQPYPSIPDAQMYQDPGDDWELVVRDGSGYSLEDLDTPEAQVRIFGYVHQLRREHNAQMRRERIPRMQTEPYYFLTEERLDPDIIGISQGQVAFWEYARPGGKHPEERRITPQERSPFCLLRDIGLYCALKNYCKDTIYWIDARGNAINVYPDLQGLNAYMFTSPHRIVSYTHPCNFKRPQSKILAPVMVCAAASGHFDALQFFSKFYGGDIPDAIQQWRDHKGFGLAHYAAASGCVQSFAVLEHCGMDAYRKSAQQLTSSMIAAYHGHVSLLRYIQEKIPVDKDECDLLVRVAFQSSYIRVIQWLHEVGLNLKTFRFSNGQTIAHWAAQLNNSTIFHLLSQYDVSFNAKDRAGKTVRDIAAEHNNTNVVEWLDQQGRKRKREE